MKTIFIALFEGVEAKNIFRTPVLGTLLSDPEVRLVCFTKSAERVEYYKQQFPQDRIVYEVVKRPRLSFLDGLFAQLKFAALKTDSTDLKRRIAYEEHGNYAFYCLARVSNWILSRPSARKLLRFLDYRLVRTNWYGPYFEKYKPDVVFLSHLFDEPEIHFLREARQFGVKVIGFINSWDKVTSRCMLRLLPDRFVVFNHLVKEELTEHNEVPSELIEVCGIPQYDLYASKEGILPREVFLKTKGIPSDHRLIVYAPLGSSFSDSDWPMIDTLYSLNAAQRFGEKVSILVRFQPNDFIDEAQLKKRPHLLYDYPGKRFSSVRGVDWDMDDSDLLHLKNTLYHMSLLVCYASSMSVDAAVFDKPILNINFDVVPVQKPGSSPFQYFYRDHYKKALATGAIALVNSEEALICAVTEYLENPTKDSEKRRKLVREQCGYTDGRSGERIGKLILSMV